MWLYLTALLSARTSSTGVALAAVLETVAHDRLTRMLPGDWSGPRPLEYALRIWCTWEHGTLMLDDPVMPQPVATAIAGLAWVFASQEHRPLEGFSLVRLVWTHGTRRIPLGMRRWHQGGAANYALAHARLSDAHHRLRGQPDDVRCEAWYPSQALLTRMRDNGWYVVCRLKQHRRCNGPALRRHRRHPSWADMG